MYLTKEHRKFVAYMATISTPAEFEFEQILIKGAYTKNKNDF